jgi:hypothetical protein
MINSFFQRGLAAEGTYSEQRLVEDLIIESIQIRGADIYYLPRTSVKPDLVLGEDILSQFIQWYPIEMYLNNVQGWDGNSELMTKFGIQVTDQATFVVSKRRWEESVALQTDNLQLPLRPAEGDLLYFPLTRAFFEITYVNHLNPFLQLSKFYVYELRCELFNYSSEVIQTGNVEMDARAATKTRDQFRYSILLQNGGLLLNQSGEPIISQAYPEAADGIDDSVRFVEESNPLIDFDVHNPFGEL